MKAFIYVYTGKQSKVLTVVINVLQILLFIYFFFVKLLSSEYFIFYFYFSSNVYPVNKPLFPPALMEFHLTISAMVKGLLQWAQFPNHPEQNYQIQIVLMIDNQLG